jgi:hypothetical protein
MKTLLPLTSATLVAVVFLSGCTDPKAPKAPPKVPEPKAAALAGPASLQALHRPTHLPALNTRMRA